MKTLIQSRDTYLLKFLDHANQEGFTFWEHQKLYTHSDDPAKLLDALAAYQTPEGWIAGCKDDNLDVLDKARSQNSLQISLRARLRDYKPGRIAADQAVALSTRSARRVTHLLGCFLFPKSAQVFSVHFG